MNEISPFDSPSFEDGRGRYPDRISANVPKRLGEATRSVAEAQGISVAEFARRAIIRALTERRDDEQQTGGVPTPRKLDGAA
jgi:hypothetical protein